ncbi:MAG TPA: glycosyltransferase N-terminal domain-containing protein, partial [Candidatus Binatia bacterium]|nr:glycosyltransferase N-terminal domain-containing protein [Candidatus Binatia bacterium]
MRHARQLVHYFIYNSLLTLASLFALPLLPLWLMLRPRFRPGLAQRFGSYAASDLQRVVGMRPVWIHAASVGETLAAAAFIAALKAKSPRIKIALSTFTDTGNEIARRRAGADAVIFLPLDHPLLVRRALAKLDPSVLIIVETEIWPNLLRQAARRGIPVLLLSGRLSDRALNRYLKFGAFFRSVLRYVAVCGMQSDRDAHRIASLGADAARIVVTGNLKQPALQGSNGKQSPDVWGAWLAQQRRPLVVGGSTHAGEEAILVEVFRALKNRFPDLQLALAPRHPERFAQVEKFLQQSGISFDKKSRLTGISFP